MKINENIKNFRTFRGIKQQQLADLLGKSKSVISNWERGENSPDLESCEKMCKILKVTPNELFGWEENPEYLNHVKRVKAYQERISQLRTEIAKMQSEINNIELNDMDDEYGDFLYDEEDE